MSRPVFHTTQFVVDSNLCFVIMPFANEFTDLYEDHIKTTITQTGFTPLRADELFNTGIIINDVWENINRARFLVADVTGRSPNVFYELGIAHALYKDVIILTQTTNDIPFDTRHIRHILYSFTPRGARKLEEELKATIMNIVFE